MRYKLLTLAIFAVGSLACQDAAPPVRVESAKMNTNAAAAPQKADAHGDHADEAPRITLADAKKDFDAGTAVFVDTRAAASYQQEHVKGAINMPMEAVETRYKEIPTGKKIIAYCS
jgi:3-mercaptopyruvate sulfurtransferase SseA